MWNIQLLPFTMTSKNVAQSALFCFVSIVISFSDVNQTRQYCSHRMRIFVACLSAIYCIYSCFVSPLSNCTDCSVIVNMSIASTWISSRWACEWALNAYRPNHIQRHKNDTHFQAMIISIFRYVIYFHCLKCLLFLSLSSINLTVCHQAVVDLSFKRIDFFFPTLVLSFSL